MPKRNQSLFAVVLLLAFAVFYAHHQIRALEAGAPALTPFQLQPERIMGTSCQLVVLAADPQACDAAPQMLQEAEANLRHLETLFSTYINVSEVSRINQAGAGEVVPLSPEVLQVLRSARAAWEQSAGAFDVTCYPLIQLWRNAGKEGRVPSAEDIRLAREASSWSDFELLSDGIRKLKATARIDLGGIAKGYSIDSAFLLLQAKPVASVLVDVGGDLRVSGPYTDALLWPVELKNPTANGSITHLHLTDMAVCTSGDYERYTTIQDQRFSHIMDPRSGIPAHVAKSVTVARYGGRYLGNSAFRSW